MRDDLERQLREAHRIWPELVQHYRTWQIPLGEMFERLSGDIFETFKVLTLRTMAADLGGAGALLEQEPFVSMPATRLYLADTWPPFYGVLAARPPLLPVDQWRPAELELGDRAVAMMTELWRRLGIRVVEEIRGSHSRLQVDEPLS